MTYYKDYLNSVKSTFAVTTTLWWTALVAVLLIVYMQLPIYLIIPCVSFMLLYTIYLWYYADNLNGTMRHDYVDVTDTEEMGKIRRSCEALEYEWNALGSPANMTSSVDMIQFLYSLRPWRQRNEMNFDYLVELADRYCGDRQPEHDRNALYRHFENCFKSYPQYEVAKQILDELLCQ